MPEPVPSASGSGALTHDELLEAFGGELGAGPETASSASTTSAVGRGEVPGPSVDARDESAARPSSAAHEAHPSLSDFREGWRAGLYRDPVLCGSFAGLVLGVLGVFVVLRRAVFVTAAVSQAAGLGVALAIWFGIALGVSVPAAAGALVLALGATALLGRRERPTRLPRETLVAGIYLASGAGAIIVGERIAGESHDIASILFGTAVLVRAEDLWLVLGVGSLVLFTTIAARRGLLFAGFDPEGARVHRLPVRLLDLLLWVLVALEVSVTTRAMGALPVFAFTVLPAMSALSITRRMTPALTVASALGGLAGGLGYMVAFFLDLPVGASQALLATLLFLGCSAAARAPGLPTRS